MFVKRPVVNPNGIYPIVCTYLFHYAKPTDHRSAYHFDRLSSHETAAHRVILQRGGRR